MKIATDFRRYVERINCNIVRVYYTPEEKTSISQRDRIANDFFKRGWHYKDAQRIRHDTNDSFTYFWILARDTKRLRNQKQRRVIGRQENSYTLNAQKNAGRNEILQTAVELDDILEDNPNYRKEHSKMIECCNECKNDCKQYEARNLNFECFIFTKK